MFRPLLISMFLTSTALADTWTVDDNGKADFDNIQAAIDAASDGDEIIVMPGTYTGTGDEVVNINGKSVWLHSSVGAEVTIIDGENARRGILCLNAKKIDQTIIEGFTISNGLTELMFPGAGMYCSGICPKITNCIFPNNNAAGEWSRGGGLAIAGWPVDISDCLFENNYSALGAAIVVGAQAVTKTSITNCVFKENVSIQGALFIDWWPKSPSAEFDLVGCEFRDNTAKEDGGAIRVWSSKGVIAIDKCVFVNNEAMSGEGGAISAGESRWRITNCTFSENKSAANGGAIRFRDLWDESIISDTVFDSNHAEGTGGGVFNAEMLDPLNPTIENCTFTGNTANSGGGMLNDNSSPTLTNCTFENNTAAYGGGMSNYQSSPTLTDCIFDGNSSGWQGGGIFCNGGSPIFTNCTISGNSVEGSSFKNGGFGGGYGGGFCFFNSTASLIECEVNGNTSSNSGGGIDFYGGEVVIMNCNITNNTSENWGGGIHAVLTNITATCCNITSNIGGRFGGGADCIECVSTFQNCTIKDNSVYGDDPNGIVGGGGGLSFHGGEIHISDCLINSNSANNGGGIRFYLTETSTSTDCTIEENFAWKNGGGIYADNCNPTITSCSIKNNTVNGLGGGVFISLAGFPSIEATKLCSNIPDQIYGKYSDDGNNTIAETCSEPEICNDITGDGIVDVLDLLAVIDSWGSCEDIPLEARSVSCGNTSIFSRERTSDIRIATWNVLSDPPGFHPADWGNEINPYARILRAIDADIIVFNEINKDEDVEALPTWLNDFIRPGTWHVHEGIDTGIRTVIASIYPLSMLETNTVPAGWTGRGVTLALVDCPDQTWTQDIYLLGVHMKAGTGNNEDLRQITADAIANWMGDARTVGEEIDLPQNTPMIIVGDTNLIEKNSPATITLLTGDIYDENTFGSDIKGDWDETDLTDPIPVDPITGDQFTIWGYKSRLDRFIFTDSVAEIGNSFVLNTTTLPEEELLANCLRENDTTVNLTSDHLPVVADFRLSNSCASDLNNDGLVNVSDLLLIISNWGPCE